MSSIVCKKVGCYKLHVWRKVITNTLVNKLGLISTSNTWISFHLRWISNMMKKIKKVAWAQTKVFFKLEGKYLKQLYVSLV